MQNSSIDLPFCISAETFMKIFTASALVACSLLFGQANTARSADAPPTFTNTAEYMFQLAAELYPTLFTNGSAPASIEGYVYKHFSQSGIYVGVKNDKVFLLGGPFGNSIKEQGTLQVVITFLEELKAKQQNGGPTADPNENPVTITGVTFSPALEGFSEVPSRVDSSIAGRISEDALGWHRVWSDGVGKPLMEMHYYKNTGYLDIAIGTTHTAFGITCVPNGTSFACANKGLSVNFEAGTIVFNNTRMPRLLSANIPEITVNGSLAFKPFSP
jgi:hypothetical protein